MALADRYDLSDLTNQMEDASITLVDLLVKYNLKK